MAGKAAPRRKSLTKKAPKQKDSRPTKTDFVLFQDGTVIWIGPSVSRCKSEAGRLGSTALKPIKFEIKNAETQQVVAVATKQPKQHLKWAAPE